MKTKLRLSQLLIMFLFSIGTLGTWAQTSQSLTQTVCVGNQPYKVDPISGATFMWSISGGVPADYQINGTGDNITVDWNTPGIYDLSVYSYIVISCPSITQSVTVTVVPQPIGPTLDVKTPNLASVCIGTDVSATFIAGSGGVGCSDAFEYRFDGGSWTTYTPGTNLSTTGHTLVEIQGQRSGCTSGAGCTGTPWVTLASWIVTPLPTASISYTGPFCTSDITTQAVTLTGTTGGTYSSTVGLSIDAATGAITPSTSTAGLYTVTYTIAASGGCGVVTAATSVTITTAPTASISYASPFCTSIVSAQAVTLTGTSGGTYTVLPAGLTINAATGAITPNTSIAGTYTVTYSIAASGGCGLVTATASITINQTPTTSPIWHN